MVGQKRGEREKNMFQCIVNVVTTITIIIIIIIIIIIKTMQLLYEHWWKYNVSSFNVHMKQNTF